MSEYASRAGGKSPTNLVSGIEYNPVVEATTASPTGFPIGSAVVQSLSRPGTVRPGRANAQSTSQVIGIAAGAGIVGRSVPVQRHGILTLTEDQWRAVLITSGRSQRLVAGTTYYLSPGFQEGAITNEPITTPGQFHTRVGLALSSTDLLILLCSPQPVT